MRLKPTKKPVTWLVSIERAKVLARALRCHPAVLVFPGWDIEYKSAA